MPRKSNKRGSAASSGPIALKLPESRGARSARRETPDVSWINRFSEMTDLPLDNATRNLLQGCTETKIVSGVSVGTVIQNSNDFPIQFPVQNVRISEIQKLYYWHHFQQRYIDSTYPLIHEDTLPLIAAWLEHKRKHGSAVEKALYEGMGLIEFVQRLLERRAFSFSGRKDRYKILEVDQGYGGWEKIGTDREEPPLVLKNYLSYDEIKLSAFLAISSQSVFINDGSQNNMGVVAPNFPWSDGLGSMLGVVRPRFEKPGFMEYQDIVIAKDQNTVENGYGETPEPPSDAEAAAGLRDLRGVWARFYGEPHFPLYEEVSEHLRRAPEHPKYVPIGRKYIFDAETYIKRTLITAEMMLLETYARAMAFNDSACLRVVGFGSDVEKASPLQEVYVLKAFEIALKKLHLKLRRVSDVVFANFSKRFNCGGEGDGGRIGRIKIHFRKTQPHTLLGVAHRVVVTYAWDGNAFPGNEFWMGELDASKASAAACSTQIAELHNVKINPCASAANLRVASPEHGILHIADYARRKL